MKTITFQNIANLKLKSHDLYEWADHVIKNMDSYILPHKTRIPLPGGEGTDYFNVMPCVLPNEGVMGVKVVSRNQKRREVKSENLTSDILLYSRDYSELLALMDGTYITTVRTAAIAVWSLLHCANKYDTIAMIGLGNIGFEIGEILFPLISDKKITVKLFKYKDHAERFYEHFKEYKNISFTICNTYDELMRDSDAVFSSVTYAANDFCSEKIYKVGCTVIPVHMRGFMECDKSFDTVITSDLESIQSFKYYNQMKKIITIYEAFNNKSSIRDNSNDRIIIYNLGLAVFDMYFAYKIYNLI